MISIAAERVKFCGIAACTLHRQEWDGGSETVFGEITKGTLPQQAKGGVEPSSRPGLGLEMDWALLDKRFAYAGRRVTPQTTPRP